LKFNVPIQSDLSGARVCQDSLIESCPSLDDSRTEAGCHKTILTRNLENGFVLLESEPSGSVSKNLRTLPLRIPEDFFSS